MLNTAGAAGSEGPAQVPVGAYIRLHVLAADDGAAAQALKLEVRDAVLAAARALRVVIGAGEGHNWWCVLYPSLCVPEGETPTAFHSALLDWLQSWLGGGR